MKLFKKIKNTINASILCIRFPFLYPRNRWTGRHYNNWTISKFHRKWYKYTQDSFFMHFVTEKPEKLEYTCDFDDRRYRIDHSENRIWIIDINDCNKVVWSANKSDFGTGKIVKTGWVDKSPYCIVDENWKSNEEINRFIVIVHAKWLQNIIKILDWIHNYPLQWFHCIPTYTELDAMEPGWRKAFGIQMCKEIKKELKKYNFLYKYRITQIKEKFGCYDTETEVLTKDGWKYFKDVTKDDEIATLNSEEYLEYQKPTDIIAYNYEGPMYRLENRGVSLKVTPNHNLYVAKGSYYNGSKNNEKRVYPLELTIPETYFGKDKRFKKGCKWEGVIPESMFKIPDYSYTNEMKINEKTGKRTRVLTGPIIDIHAFLRFLGFYVAEGCTNIRKGSGTEIMVAYNLLDEEELVTKLITDIGFIPKQSKGCKRFSSASLAYWLKENCGHLAPNKKVPDFIKQLAPEYIEEFLKYLFIGDGYQSKTANVLTTTSKQLRDDVCELLLKCGYSFSYYKREPKKAKPLTDGRLIQGKHIAYYINWLQSTDVEIDNSKAKSCKSFIESWEDYNDMVYCVTVPNHIIYVRRNGKGVWCGNSLRWSDSGIPKDSKIWGIIEKYSEISYKTCINCGKSATKISTGWISPYCDNCIGDRHYVKIGEEPWLN